MNKHIREDFCGTCVVAAGLLFAGSGTAAIGAQNEDDPVDGDDGDMNWLVVGGISLVVIALLIFLYGKFGSSCESCRI
jgi:hypothetical protein